MVSRIARVGLLFLVLVGFFSCGTKKTTVVSRAYHNLTSHYNGFYNAKLKLAEGAQKLAESDKDNYDKLLHVYRYGDVAKAKSVYPQMDDAIKRCSEVIENHSVSIKGKEYTKWIDDNWMVIGKAQFYKHDFYSALETFQYVATNYPLSNTKHEALLWQAKTNLELTKLNDAENIFDYLRNERGFPADLKGDFEGAQADFYMQTKNYPKAIEHLEKAVIFARKRDDRSRRSYILGQLYQKELGDNAKAFEMYTQVIKLNPPYEMAFNANMARARCFSVDGKNSGEIKAKLQKMAKDEKNKDFLDQIYFSLATIALKESDTATAVTYLNQSVKANTSNTAQKASAFLELAKIHFIKRDYKIAQAYYDSTITFLATDYPDYDDVLVVRNSLTKLIKNMRVIALEDSVQKIGKMSPKEQEQFVDKLIQKEKDEIEKQKQEKLQQSQIFKDQRTSTEEKQVTGSWYFYNAQAMSFGFTDFLKKWGDRKLEDNWRRSDKETLAPEDLEELEPGATKKDDTKSDSAKWAEKRKKYLESIPSDAAAVEKSTTKIVDAYYNIAMIYKEQLNDFPKAIATFEELLKRFPENKYKLQCYYQLYRTCLAMGDTAAADRYKDILLNKYPDSEYAALIKNPNVKVEMTGKAKALKEFYEDTYKKYMNGQYDAVIASQAQADAQYADNPLKPKFDLLRALSIGHTQSVAMFESSLNDIVRLYPRDPVKDKAQELLDYIHNTSNEPEPEKKTDKKTTAKDTTAAAGPLFVYNPDTTQILIITFGNNTINANTLKTKLSDYNSKYYSNSELSIGGILLDPKTQMITVREFADVTAAQQYSSGLLNNEEVYSGIKESLYQQLIISANNLPALLRDKHLDKYVDFFERFYK